MLEMPRGEQTACWACEERASRLVNCSVTSTTGNFPCGPGNTQLVKHLLYKPEDLSLDPGIHRESWCAYVCPVLEGWSHEDARGSKARQPEVIRSTSSEDL